MTTFIPEKQWRKGKKDNKFKAQAQRYKGMFFPSKKELKRWMELESLRDCGDICDLRRQVPYKFYLNEKLMFTYRADFVYKRDGKETVEDAKGVILPIYTLKKKIIEAAYGITIVEV
jgi:hypothetical protein